MAAQDVEDRRVIVRILPCVVNKGLETVARSKRSKSESTQGAVAILKEKKKVQSVSQNSDPKKSVLREDGRTWYEIQIRERKGPSQCARKAAWNLARKINKLKAEDKGTFYSPVDFKASVLVSKNTEGRMFVVDSGASMHMLSKKDLSSDEMDTVRRSRNPPTVVTACGEVQTKRRGTSVCSRFRSVRHSAISRRNANSSIAW